MAELEVVEARPHRVRVVAWIAAIAIVVIFAALSTALTGSLSPGDGGEAFFRPGDQAAMIGLGFVFALAILAFTRPRVRADRESITVRNIVGETTLPWAYVREIRFDRRRAFASLELENDDSVTVLALQVADKQRAVIALQKLRALHAQARATLTTA